MNADEKEDADYARHERDGWWMTATVVLIYLVTGILVFLQ
jgi:hypothetical protein